jgi:spermidine/putrescine transport system permease protein
MSRIATVSQVRTSLGEFRAPTGGWAFAGVTVIWVLAVIVPLAGLILFSFFSTEDVRFVLKPSLQSYINIFENTGWSVILRSVRVAVTITVIELLLAFPFAVWLAKVVHSRIVSLVIFSLLTVPFFLSPASRTIVWRVVLGLGGPINSLLMTLGVVDKPIDWLLFSEPAVHFGLIGPYFPSMVWPIFLSVSLIDDEFLEASKDLGARPVDTLRNIVIPLAMPGVLAGIIFTFVPLLGDTVVAQLIGGGNVLLLSASISNLITVMNYSDAAAMSAFVLVLMLLLQVPLLWTLQKIGGIAQIFGGLRR